MGFLRYANAAMVRPFVTKTEWQNIRTAGRKAVTKGLSGNLVERATEFFGKEFDPSQYLLSHATILASVDTYSPPGIKTGSVMENGNRINRKYSDFRIKVECNRFINNNFDSWPRGVVLKAYPTFIGSHNFCFAPGTEVLMSDGTCRAIDAIRVGDEVISHTGDVRKVTRTFVRDYDGDMRVLSVDRFKDPLLVTGNHPFRVISDAPELAASDVKCDSNWKSAESLCTGQYLLVPECNIGTVRDFGRVRRVSANSVVPYKGPVYNIEVEEDHSYVVAPGLAVHNCEHVQVEDLSKGRVIDAVARDIVESVYVDILIATDRKHTELIQAIENGKMTTLSMGCSVDETTCTRCGHVAADETELCTCIKYEKGNTFFDEQGNKNINAELCGHPSIDPHGGVLFMDASWVRTPAFTGAVLRNVIEPSEAIARRAQYVLSTPPPQWSSDAMLRAAADGVVKTLRPSRGAQVGRIDSLELCQPTLVSDAVDGKEGSDFLAGWADDGGGGEAPADEPAAPAPPAPPGQGGEADSPFKDVEESVYKKVLDRVKKRLEDSLAENAGAAAPTPEQSSSTNENLFKQARRQVFEAGVEAITKTASSDIQLLDSMAAFDKKAGLTVPVEMYRTVLKVGSYDQYASVTDYWTKCCQALGRNPTRMEGRMLLRLGKLLSQRKALVQRSVRSLVGGGKTMAVATDKRSKT